MRTNLERLLKRLSGWAFYARRLPCGIAKRCGGVKRRWKKRLRKDVAEAARGVWEALRTDDERTATPAFASVGETALLTSGKRRERRSTEVKTPSVVLTFDDVWTFRSPRLVVWNGGCEEVRSWLDVYELTLNRLLAARGAENFLRDVAKAGLSAYFAREPRDDWRYPAKIVDGVYFERRPAPEFLRANLNRLTEVVGFPTDDWRFECVEVRSRN